MMVKSKWFIHCETDMVGTDSYELIEAETEEEADFDAREMAYDNFQSYDFSQTEEECEEDGVEFIEGEYYSWSVEKYDPKEHNGMLYDSELKEDDALSESDEKLGEPVK